MICLKQTNFTWSMRGYFGSNDHHLRVSALFLGQIDLNIRSLFLYCSIEVCYNSYFAVCPDNTFGDSCDQTCKCQNEALCDARNGSCTCEPGFMGVTCETGMLYYLS